MTQVNTQRLLTVPQVSEITSRSSSSVWADVRNGRLKAMRFGRSVRIHPDDFAEYVNSARAAVSDGLDLDE